MEHATHEIGHWFNLFHLWGDNNCGNDWVNDTHIQEQANFGCKMHPHTSLYLLNTAFIKNSIYNSSFANILVASSVAT